MRSEVIQLETVGTRQVQRDSNWVVNRNDKSKCAFLWKVGTFKGRYKPECDWQVKWNSRDLAEDLKCLCRLECKNPGAGTEDINYIKSEFNQINEGRYRGVILRALAEKLVIWWTAIEERSSLGEEMPSF